MRLRSSKSWVAFVLIQALLVFGTSACIQLQPRYRFPDLVKRLPNLKAYVNDFEELFTEEQRLALENRLSEYEQKTTREVVVVTTSSSSPYESLEDFAVDLANYNGIGKKHKDNGLLLIVSRKMRSTRISTGLGTEKVLTDRICKAAIDDHMIPELKQGNYYAGTESGLNALLKTWDESPEPEIRK